MKYKVRKRDYVTQNYIDNIYHYVYNDLDLKEIYTEDEPVICDDVMDELVKPGEEYASINSLDNVVITSLGRVINLSRALQYSVLISPVEVHLYVRQQRISFPKLFEANGWDYDFKKIRNNYTKYNWKYAKS